MVGRSTGDGGAMFRGSVCVCVLCGLGLAGTPALGDAVPGTPSIDALTRRVDPREDDWESELRQVEASAQLERLARLLRDGA